MPPILLVYAHPDDEIFGAAGTMAALRERGLPVTLVCATRGEAGEISDPALATPETLAAVREGELRTAMAALDVDDVRFLDYRDSGMEGTPENDDPRALVQQPEAIVAAQIAAVIRDVRPRAVVTFGPDGVYGHPDHLYVHRATVRAVHLAPRPLAPFEVSALYFSTTPRERLQERAALRRGPFKDMKPERLALIGTPRAEITTALDVGRYLQRKRAAIRAHRTQFGPDGPMAELPGDEVDRIFSREHFVRFRLPWSAPGAGDDPLAALEAEIGTTPL
jgi:N-acetyl-1-D-myo-inositol-2-amino-2-deoxy-alpha-D-glucopyranoside deacetylase